MNRKLYDVLGAPSTADAKTLKKAYRKLARKHHPDKNAGDPDAERRFKEVGSAWEVLGDPEKRKLYDEFGEASLQSGFDPARARQWSRGAGGQQVNFDGAMGFEDLFGDIFGGRGSGAPRRRGPADTRAELAVDFTTAALGGERHLSFQDGRALSVRIPPGVRDGETLRLRGKGSDGGDLLLTLKLASHPVFRRKGEDIHLDVPVTIGEALRGGSVEIPTPSGSVRLRVPPGTQNGKTLRLRGKGITRRGGRAGDLYAHVDLRLPDGADLDALEHAIDAIEAAYGADVRSALAGLGSRRAAA